MSTIDRSVGNPLLPVQSLRERGPSIHQSREPIPARGRGPGAERTVSSSICLAVVLSKVLGTLDSRDHIEVPLTISVLLPIVCFHLRDFHQLVATHSQPNPLYSARHSDRRLLRSSLRSKLPIAVDSPGIHGRTVSAPSQRSVSREYKPKWFWPDANDDE
jgi:hypothetical protein